MGDIRIYLAGGVTGLAPEEANAWRIKIIELLKNTDGYYRPRCINPTDYYNYSMPSDSYTQREKYSENTKKGARGIEIGQVISGIRNWVSELAEIE